MIEEESTGPCETETTETDADTCGLCDPDSASCWGYCPRAGAHSLKSCEVPEFQQVPFVLSGYRGASSSLFERVRLVFGVHNQTGNIWTHLLGSAYFAFYGVQLYADYSSLDGLRDFEPISVLILVAASFFCLASSTSYHICCFSKKCIFECTYKMDLSGIVVLIGTSYFTGIVLGYRCRPGLRLFYLLYTLAVLVALTGPLVRPSLVANLPRHMIVCVALGLVPAGHFFFIASAADAATMLPYILMMFGCYGVGAIFYITRWPESRWPGRFDLLGQSHQMWHLFVFLAAASWVHGCGVYLRVSGGPECAQIE